MNKKILILSVFVVASCGLAYELIAGALSSYLLGDSILQFSTIIGTYLFAMGVGSWLSRYFERQLPAHFLRIELLVALIGGALPATLFLANAYVPGAFRFLLYGMVLMVGTLVGLEIPLVMRILKRNTVLKDLVSQVLTFDYLGALAVSLAFPLLLVPQLGLIRTGLFFGLLNGLVAVWALWLFRHELRRLRVHVLACAGVLLTLLVVPTFYDSIEIAKDRMIAKFQRRDARWNTAVAFTLTFIEAVLTLVGIRMLWRGLVKLVNLARGRRGPVLPQGAD